MRHQFRIGHNDLPRSTLQAGYPSEAFEDVVVEFGAVRPHDNTYSVVLTSYREASLDQAALFIRNLATRQRALRADNRLD
ncbi:MAG TPA: hypothetical protein VJM46_03845 [Candidatus Saccharimonadales bacterium]|nr:hypothetical protein [Candidatus Saccharimonadales bacterium]